MRVPVLLSFLISFHPPVVLSFWLMQSHFLKVEYKLPSKAVPIEHAMRLIHTPEKLFGGAEYTGVRATILKSDLPVLNGNHTSVRMCLRMGWNLQEMNMFTASPYRSNALFTSHGKPLALFRVRVDPWGDYGHVMNVNATIYAPSGALLRIAEPVLGCIKDASDPFSLPVSIRRDKNLALYRRAVLGKLCDGQA